MRWCPVILCVCMGLAAPAVEAACAHIDPEAMREQAIAALPPAPPPEVTILYDPDRLSETARPPPPDILPHMLEAMRRDCAGEPPTRNPLADTVFLRHPGLLPKMPDDVRRVMVAAEIARTTPVAIDLLMPLTRQERSPFVRYRALLEMLLRSMRAPGNDPAKLGAWLKEARTLVPPAGGQVDPAADLDFIKGKLCLDAGGGVACRPHFDLALERDGWFVAARQVRIGLIDAQIRAVRARPAARRRCDALLTDLMADIENILRGVSAGRGRIAVANALDGMADAGNVALYLGAAHAYAGGNARGRAAQAFADAEAGLENDLTCNAIIRERIDDFRTLVFDR